MNKEIIYTTAKASSGQIEEHLQVCNKAFIPPLSEKVNIGAYAQKIFANAITFEAWKETVLIGLIAAYENKENCFFFITNVSVLPTFSEKGIGATLLQACIKRSKEQEMKLVKLEVNKKNKPAIKFYQKYGFIQTGEKDETIMMDHQL